VANILVYIDVQGNRPHPRSLTALNYGRRIASQYGATLYAVLPCAKTPTYGSDDIISVVSRYGADKALLVQGDHLAGPPLACTHLDAIVACARAIPPGLFIFPGTTAGHELGPAFSSRMGSSYQSDVSATEDAPLELSRRIFQGRVQMRQEIEFRGRPSVVVLSATRAAPTIVGNDDAEVFVVQAPLPRRGPKQLESVSVSAGLSNARVVVGGGRGLLRPENFTLMERYAEALGAHVGASRGAIAMGLCRPELQLGIDGQAIDADLYFAFGISGSNAHLAAIPSHTTIVAINADKNAPIFRMAQFGLVADAEATLRALLKNYTKANGVSAGERPNG
jgi:electron transfer flavoprotein alpha subunit